jgi:hypothetical protein
MLFRRDVVIRAVLPRAFVLWALIRLVFAALGLASGAIGASLSPPPMGVVLLCGLVGLIDVRVRRERVLWANLGVTPQVLFATYSAAAVPAEIALALIAR